MSLGDWNLTSRNRRETNCSRRLHMRGSYRKPRLPMENSWMQGSYGAMFEPPRSTRQVKNDMLFRFTSNLVKRKTSTHCVFTVIEFLRSFLFCFFKFCFYFWYIAYFELHSATKFHLTSLVAAVFIQTRYSDSISIRCSVHSGDRTEFVLILIS